MTANFDNNCDENRFSNILYIVRAAIEKRKVNTTNMSELFCVSADESFVSPVIKFKGAVIQFGWVSEIAYPGTYMPHLKMDVWKKQNGHKILGVETVLPI